MTSEYEPLNEKLTNLSRSVRNRSLTLTLVCIFSLCLVSTIQDIDLLSDFSMTELPIINIKVSVNQFFQIIPSAILLLFIYQHLYLSEFYKEVSRLPLIFQDGKAIHEKIPLGACSYLLITSISSFKNYRDTMSYIGGILYYCQLYLLAPYTVGVLLYRFLPKQDLHNNIWWIIAPYFFLIMALWFFCLIGRNQYFDNQSPLFEFILLLLLFVRFISCFKLKHIPHLHSYQISLVSLDKMALALVLGIPVVSFLIIYLLHLIRFWIIKLKLARSSKNMLYGIFCICGCLSISLFTGLLYTIHDTLTQAKGLVLPSGSQLSSPPPFYFERAFEIDSKIDMNNTDKYERKFALCKQVIPFGENENGALNLNHLSAKYAFLVRAQLEKASLQNADLRGADLSWSWLFDSDLENANLREANLSGANLSKANLSKANLQDSKLIATIFTESDLTGVTGLTWDQLRYTTFRETSSHLINTDSYKYLYKAKLPQDLMKTKPSWYKGLELRWNLELSLPQS
jgi:hypothetical protein